MRLRTLLLTFGIAIVATVAIVASTGEPETIGYRLGRTSVPIVAGSLGLLWRRRPMLGYWLVFVATLALMAVGARG